MKTICWFDYKTVIITGASSGIGKGLTERLIKDHNCRVIGIARNEEKLKKFKAELGWRGERFTYYALDVAVRSNWETVAKDLKTKKIIPDILINNAGVLPKFDNFMSYSQQDVETAMSINFYSSVYSMNTMMPLILRSKNAAVINIASSAALCSLAGTSLYSASKAALKSFTDAVREEYRGRCYIGLVCPGFTKTDIFRNQSQSSENAEKAMNLISTDCDKMVDLILKGMWKKKEDMVFGKDAHIMDKGRQIFGTSFSWISSQVMRLSGLSIFKDVFKKI